MVDELHVQCIIYATNLEPPGGIVILSSLEGQKLLFDLIMVHIKCFQHTYVLDSRLWSEGTIAKLKTANVDFTLGIFHNREAKRRYVLEVL